MARTVKLLALGGLALAATAACRSQSAEPGLGVRLLYPHASRSTLTQSPHEHLQDVATVTDRDTRALIEDLDLLFMTDRPTRLTRWHTR